jgi:metal-dependent amidase/aminoacylase/carboxypeptidase family protein
MKGTLRTFEISVRDQVIRRFGQIVDGIAHAFGCETKYEIKSIAPAVVNDPAVTSRVQQVVKKLLPQSELDTTAVTMGSEDMAFVQQKIPGCYIFVGSANHAKGLDAPHHSPKFDIDESILPIGAGLMVAAALDILNGNAIE